MTVHLSKTAVQKAVRAALAEDVGSGDVTTRRIVRRNEIVTGAILAQAEGVVAGFPLVKEVFRRLSRKVKVDCLKADGSRVSNGDTLVLISGPVAPILTGERTALNFYALLSGVATATRRYADAVAGTRAQVYDTRKTPPGLRLLVKYAVLMGGGRNHRLGLYDDILIKDNHIRLAGSVREAVRRAQQGRPKRIVEVEAETLDQVREAVASRADLILLDNFTHADLKQAVALAKGRAKLEVSGGMNLASAKDAAQLGVDRVSVGALTHSAPWLTMHLELE